MLLRRQFDRMRLLVAALLLGLAVLLLPATALADDDYSIDRVIIDATVETDGSVAVHESREFDFDGSFHGVYWKIPKGEYEGRTIEPTVTSVGEMIGGEYVEFPEDYSGDDHTYQLSDYGDYLEVKLYSAHSYEDATFVINYTDTNLAARYEDVSELYWKFVSDGWDEPSFNVTCTVHLPVPEGRKVEPEESVRAWGHGPLDATVSFDGDDIVYWVPGVGTYEFAEARIVFPTDWLSEATTQKGRVLSTILEEEQRWADEANARRERARVLTYGSLAVCIVGTVLSIIGSLWALIRYRRRFRPTFDDTYFRDVPSNDHPAVLGALYRGGDPEGEDLTASLIRLTDLGAITLDKVTFENKGPLSKSKLREDYRLTLTEKAADMQLDPIDRKTLDLIFERIGRFARKGKRNNNSPSTCVCFGDLEKVAKKNPQRYHDAVGNWNFEVTSQVSNRQFYTSSRPTGKGLSVGCAFAAGLLVAATFFLFIITEASALLCFGLMLAQIGSLVLGIFVSTKIKSMSDEAIELKAKLVALRRWLKDFTRLEEAIPTDVVLWDRLLVMAVVLGVAEEVIKQLKTVMPQILEDPVLAPTYGWYYGGMGRTPYKTFNENHDTAHHVSAAAVAASSVSSGGGGGGGFSGGGGGGFGGGGGGGAF